MNDNLLKIPERAKNASYIIKNFSETKKNEALNTIADYLISEEKYILSENEKDLRFAEENGVKRVMLDRLKLTSQRIYDIADGVREVSKLKDPIGEATGMTKRPNGLMIGQKRVPLGVVGIIYEARPNVTADAAS